MASALSDQKLCSATRSTGLPPNQARATRPIGDQQGPESRKRRRNPSGYRGCPSQNDQRRKAQQDGRQADQHDPGQEELRKTDFREETSTDGDKGSALGAGNIILRISEAGIYQQGLPSMQRRWASRILVLRVTLASEAAAFDGLRVDRHSLAPRPASKAIIAPPHVISCQGAGLLPLLRASIAFRCRLSETLRHMGEFFAANEGFTRWSRMKAIGSLPIARSAALSMFEECNPWLNWWSSGSTTRPMRIAS